MKAAKKGPFLTPATSYHQNSDPKGDVIAALLRREKQFRIITLLNYVTEVTVYFSECCYRRLHQIEYCGLVLKCSYRFE